MFSNLSERLYERLPSIYKVADRQIKPVPFPLKRFLRLLTEEGFNQVVNYLADIDNSSDIYSCDAVFLSHLAYKLGFDFPCEMSESDKRKFLAILPKLYKMKGTSASFNYLAREMFGSTAQAHTEKSSFVDGMSPEDARKLIVTLDLDGEVENLQDKEKDFRSFCEMLRPVNTKLLLNLSMFYLESISKNIQFTYPEYLLQESAYNDSLKLKTKDECTTKIIITSPISTLNSKIGLSKGFRLNPYVPKQLEFNY